MDTKIHKELNETTVEQTADENAFIQQTMLTCIGNKRKLTGHIRHIIEDVRCKLGKEKLNIVDGFAGSGVVSRALSYVANTIHSNDLEYYSYLMAECFMNCPPPNEREHIQQHINAMNVIAKEGPYVEGIICKLYAPRHTNDVKEGERCFYTRENALIIDTMRHYIAESVEEHLQTYCLVPLLTKASIHTNTAGVFKGFYKNGQIGCFGGKQKCALGRIMKPIQVEMPMWNHDSSYVATVSQMDINVLVEKHLPSDIDMIYLDPPYNQHPYGSNYFMLNVIAKNEEPAQISKVSGIPNDWNKSPYNYKQQAIDSMKHLLHNGLIKSKYLLMSYNNEGIIPSKVWTMLLQPYELKKYEIPYSTFKGCRNLKDRNNKVMEELYLIQLKSQEDHKHS